MALTLPWLVFAVFRRRGRLSRYGLQPAPCDCSWAVSSTQYAVKVGDFQWCESHPANRSLGRKQPERRKEVTTCVEVLW